MSRSSLLESLDEFVGVFSAEESWSSVEGELDGSWLAEILLHAWNGLSALVVSGQHWMLLQQVRVEEELTFEVLEEEKVGVGDIVASDVFSLAQELGESVQLGGHILRVFLLELQELRVVDDPDKVHVVVSHLSGGQLDSQSVLLSLADKIVLLGQIAQDDRALAQLDVAVQVVGQVGKVQTQTELVGQPLWTLEVGWRTRRVKLVLVLSIDMMQQIPDWVGQLVE